MIFIPSKKKRDEIVSIRWIARKGIYSVSYDGEEVGNLLVDSMEKAQLLQEGHLFYQDHDKNHRYHFYTNSSAYQDTQKFEVAVTNNVAINDLGFGVFKLASAPGLGMHFKPFRSTTKDANIVENKNLVNMIRDFYSTENTGRKNKKGFLLYGPPGNGKTTEIMQLFPLAEEMQLRILLVDKNMGLSDLGDIQSLLEKDRTIFVMEEITERLAGRGTEDLLTFLDGEASWNNAVVIATTNNPEDMPANLVDRPGRFDTFIEYTNPTKADIIKIGLKYGMDESQVAPLFGEKLSFDYVSFILSECKKSNKPVDQMRKEETEKRRRLSATFRGKIGIGGDD